MPNIPEDISLEAARQLVSPLMKTIGEKNRSAETIPLESSLGRILAQDIIAPIDVPSHHTAAVDGYAFYFDELNKPLPVTESIKAGHPFKGEATSGRAYRIFTGAVMPHGPDTVAMQEDCHFDAEQKIILPQHLMRGANYRTKGENIAKGAIALQQGAVIGAAEIGLAAAMGLSELTVRQRLKVALISMGDEIVDINTPDKMGLGTIFDSNRPMLKAMLEDMGHEIRDYGIVPDDKDSLAKIFKKASANTDVILCSGGSSEGDEDHTKSAIIEGGGVIDFWRLALKPGRPMVSGRLGTIPIFGLPGNPVAAFVCTRLFAGPMMAIVQGGAGRLPPSLEAISGFTKPHKKGRAEYLRARLDDDGKGGVHIILNGRSGAGVLSSLTGADGLVEIPPSHDDVKIGDTLPFLMFREAGL